MHFDRRCRQSHLSLSLNRFVQNHPLTVVIAKQMNRVLSMLIDYLKAPHVLETCNCEEGFNRPCLWVCELYTPKSEHDCKIKTDCFIGQQIDALEEQFVTFLMLKKKLKISWWM